MCHFVCLIPFRYTGSLECANSLSLVYTPKLCSYRYVKNSVMLRAKDLLLETKTALAVMHAFIFNLRPSSSAPFIILLLRPFYGNSKESDPTNALANTSANVLADTPPTHYRHVGRHTINASADTLPTRRSTLYQWVGQNTFLLWQLFYFFQLKKARTTTLERKKAW